MHSTHFDIRKSGIPLIGDLPWGSHFCQLYRTSQDLLEVAVPYLKAGLAANEFCAWVTSADFCAEDAVRALKKAVPCFEECLNKGQIEIMTHTRWRARGGKSGKAVLSLMDKAVDGGYAGVRLVCNAPPDKAGGYDVVSRHNVVAMYAYPRDEIDAPRLMDLVKNHRYALVRSPGGWEVIKSSEAQIVKDELRRSEEKLKSLFSYMSEGFAYHRIMLDARGRPIDYVFLEINAAFEELTGLKAKKIINRRVTEVMPGIENDPTDWIGKYGRVALTGKPLRFESYSESIGKWFSVSAFSPHKGYFAVTFRDCTANKQYQQELERKTLHLEAMNRELESFSYSVSHDLRTPLRGLDAFSQELLEDYADKLDENGRDSLERIRAASQRMGILIDGLLNLSRVSRLDLKRELVDLSAIALDIANSLVSVQAERQVEFTVGEGLTAEGDEYLLYVVLQNLLDNAWKFTGKRGEAKIEFGQAEVAGSQAYFVRDNGAGFDMAYAGKLFSPFQRLHHHCDFPGTGIGLATVNRIVQRHGGRLWAEGEIDKGAAFFFTLD